MTPIEGRGSHNIELIEKTSLFEENMMHGNLNIFFFLFVQFQACKESCLAYNQLERCGCMEYRFPADGQKICIVKNIISSNAHLKYKKSNFGPDIGVITDLTRKGKYCLDFFLVIISSQSSASVRSSSYIRATS